MTTFKDAFKIYWKANPWYRIALFFSLGFVGLTLWAGGAPFAFWAIIIAVYITLGLGTFFNVKKIQERENKKK